MLVRIFDHLSYNIHIVIREVLILDMTVTVHEARTYNPTCKMIFLILSFTILICVNPIKSGATTPEDSNILGDGNGVKCEEMNKPGWSILSLANKTLDAWPWSCINSRYTETKLNEEISKFSPDIFDATARDYIGYVQYFLEKRGADLCENFNEDREKPMHVAIAKGHMRIVKYFLTNNLNLSCNLLFVSTKEDFFSPPMSAAITGQLDILKYLLDEIDLYKFRNPNDTNQYLPSKHLDENLNRVVWAAARGGQQHVLKYLVDEKSVIIKPDDGPVLGMAAFGGNVDMLKYLLYEKNMDVTRKLRDADFFNCENLTLLCDAAAGGKLDAVIFLFGIMNRTQDINYDDKRVWSRLLFAAVEGGNLPMIKYIIEEKNVDIDSLKSGRSLLHIAANDGHLAVLKYLLELKNMDVDLKSSGGATPLYEAITQGNLYVIKYLAGERNASLNTSPGSNALLQVSRRRKLTGASNENDLKIVQFLVDNMKMISRIDEVDYSNETAAMKAAFMGKLDVLKFLIDDRHANTSILHPANKTLLHFAAEGISLHLFHQDNNMPVLKYLIEEKGFKVSARTTKNETVFDIALNSLSYYENRKVLLYLKKKLKQEYEQNGTVGSTTVWDGRITPTTPPLFISDNER